jgi:hypothetical protein
VARGVGEECTFERADRLGWVIGERRVKRRRRVADREDDSEREEGEVEGSRREGSYDSEGDFLDSPDMAAPSTPSQRGQLPCTALTVLELKAEKTGSSSRRLPILPVSDERAGSRSVPSSANTGTQWRTSGSEEAELMEEDQARGIGSRRVPLLGRAGTEDDTRTCPYPLFCLSTQF